MIEQTTDEADVAPQGTPEQPRWIAAGEPYLLTRAELVAELAAEGVNVTDRQLKSWATRGLLPKPMRRVPPGATDGRPYALYPSWILGVVREILGRMRAGRTVEDIKESAPRIWQQWEKRKSEFTPYTYRSEIFPATRDISYEIQQSIGPAVWRYTELLQVMKTPVTSVDVTLHFEDGASHTVRLEAYHEGASD